MQVHLIVYSSQSLIPPAYAEREIADLVAKSVAQNGRYGITGVLLYSDERRFAQALEGDAAAVGAVMAKIRNDARHNHITMLYEGAAPRRRYANWSLAYRGRAPAVDQAIAAAEAEVGHPSQKALGEIVGIMDQLVGHP